MVKARIIPSLLICNDRCVKSIKFKDYSDVGSPVSSAKIYEAQGADELILINIKSEKINSKFIEMVKNISYECYMPLTIGGGIKSIEDMKKLFKSGADRIMINSIALKNPEIIQQASSEFGAQAVIVSIDYCYNSKKNPIIINNFGNFENSDPIKWANSCQDLGAGEILFTCKDRDGTKKGLDLDYINKFSSSLDIPVVASGGVGTLDDIYQLFCLDKISGVGVGSLLNFYDQSIIKIHSYLKQKGISVRDI